MQSARCKRVIILKEIAEKWREVPQDSEAPHQLCSIFYNG